MRRTRGIDISKNNLRECESTQLSGVELLDHSVRICMNHYQPLSTNQPSAATPTLLDPRLSNRLSTHEHDNGRLAGRLYRLDQVHLRPNQTQIAQIDMFARCCVCSRRPEQRLVQAPCSDHHECDIRRLRSCHGGGDARGVVRPEFAPLGEVDFDRRVGQVLGEASERRDAVEAGIEEDIVAELNMCSAVKTIRRHIGKNVQKHDPLADL